MNRIVVIEDDLAVLRGLTDTLRTESYDVLTSTNGEDGFRLIEEHSPDLLILDLLLPGMNGYDVCRRVRNNGLMTRILMLSAKCDEESRVQGFNAGADDYMTKPFSLRELIGRVRAILRRSEDRSNLPYEWSKGNEGASSEWWAQVDRLVQALRRESDERAAFLRKACARDESLLHEVESLLPSYEEAGNFLDEPATSVLPPTRSTAAPGRRIGPYELVSFLSSGGMGEVYRATDTRLNRPVAIKLLPADLSRDPGLRHRLKREGQAVSCLNHPHICTLFDIGRHEEMDYLVMEYLEGETLADRLSKAEIPIEQALQYAIELADALSAAHRQGVIHRDIKPGNIMLVETGTKLLDFGLARISDPTPRNIRSRADEENVQTQCGAIVGTIQYMSPEQLEGGIADERADIFALGAVLYEMFAARKAFEGKSHASLITSIMSSMPPPISTVRPVVPEAIDPLIQKCLHKDPEERWQSASDVRSELERIAASVPEKTTPQRLLPVSTNAEALSWGSLALGCTLGLSLGVIFSVKGRREG